MIAGGTLLSQRRTRASKTNFYVYVLIQQGPYDHFASPGKTLTSSELLRAVFVKLNSVSSGTAWLSIILRRNKEEITANETLELMLH